MCSKSLSHDMKHDIFRMLSCVKPNSKPMLFNLMENPLSYIEQQFYHDKKVFIEWYAFESTIWNCNIISVCGNVSYEISHSIGVSVY